MKKILLTLLFLTSSLFAELNWVENLEDAYDVAEKENKIVFVILSQRGCPACKYMKDIVLEDANVIEELNKDFVAVYLDIHHDDVPLELEHFVTPTLYFLDSNEKILHRTNGYENIKEFLEDLDSAKMQRD
jgi:thiol-disulfide isomerase/thioredoxin